MVQSHVSYRWTTSQYQRGRRGAGNSDYSQSKSGPVKRATTSTGRSYRRFVESLRRLDPPSCPIEPADLAALAAVPVCGDGSPCRPCAPPHALPHSSTRAPSPSDGRPCRPCSQSPAACSDPSMQIRDPLWPLCPPRVRRSSVAPVEIHGLQPRATVRCRKLSAIQALRNVLPSSCRGERSADETFASEGQATASEVRLEIVRRAQPSARKSADPDRCASGSVAPEQRRNLEQSRADRSARSAPRAAHGSAPPPSHRARRRPRGAPLRWPGVERRQLANAASTASRCSRMPSTAQMFRDRSLVILDRIHEKESAELRRTRRASSRAA